MKIKHHTVFAFQNKHTVFILQKQTFKKHLLSPRLEGEETLKYRCVCGPPSGKV